MEKPTTRVAGRRDRAAGSDEPFDLKSARLEDPNFLERLAQHLSATDYDPNVLLNIPIWGWTGHGKTCALLTAVQFCAAPEYPLGLSMVNDSSELARFEAGVEEYKGMNLAGTAATTTARLRALSKTFLDEAKWPPGTDEASSYVLEVRSARRAICYAIFPDLKGGSYREPDDASRTVLSTAHACIVLVDPVLYERQSVDGKLYRDEVAGRLQRLAADAVPFCLMISKSDLHRGEKSPADAAHRSLGVLVNGLKSERSAMTQISVIGDKVATKEGDDPAPLAERQPSLLARSWVWTIAQALATPVAEIRRRRPRMQLRASIADQRLPASKALPELRRVGDYSDGPGRVLCATPELDGRASFVFLSGDSELVQVAVHPKGEAEPAMSALGTLEGWDEGIDDVQSDHRAGELVIGARSKANSLWLFSQSAGIRRTPLPFEAGSWVLVTSRRLVAIDASGRLSCLELESEKWIQRDYLEKFVPPSPLLRCGALEHEPIVLVANGSTIEGVRLDEDGHFGTRIDAPFALKYDADTCQMTGAGLAAAVMASKNLVVGVGSKSVDLGAVAELSQFPRAYALAPQRRAIAWVSDDMLLSAAAVSTDGIVVTARQYASEVSEGVNGMAWTRDATALVVSYADSTWNVFRPLGIDMR